MTPDMFPAALSVLSRLQYAIRALCGRLRTESTALNHWWPYVAVLFTYVCIDLPVSHNTSPLPSASPHERSAPPLRTGFLVAGRPDRSRTDPELPAAVGTRFLRRQADARLGMAFAPGRRFLGEEL
jgi:hypothetical protein